MLQTLEHEEQVSARLARIFFGVFVLIGLAGISIELYRYSFTRPYLLLVPIILFGLSTFWVVRKANYSKREFQSRISVLLILMAFEVLLSISHT